MLYEMPKINKFFKFIQKYKLYILIIFTILITHSIFNFNQNQIITNESFWIQENQNNHNYSYLTTINFKVDEINEKNIKELKRISNVLTSKFNNDVETLFNINFLEEDNSGGGSEFFKVKNNNDLTVDKIIKLKSSNKKCLKYINNKTFKMFIYSNDDNLKISLGKTFLKYEIIKDFKYNDTTKELIYLFASFFVLILLFYIFFKNFISGIGSIIIVLGTTLFTLNILNILIPNTKIHISMLFIIVSISLLDYIFFYFRWHVFHRSMTSSESMEYSLKSNMKPAFWTSVITILSLSILLYSDSNIVKLIALMSIIPSIIAYILNIFIFPSFFGYFTINNPHLGYKHLSARLSKNVVKYNSKLFKLFKIIITMIIVFISFTFIYTPYKISNNVGNNNIIVLTKEKSSNSYNDYLEIKNLYNNLNSNFDNIISIESMNFILEKTSKLQNNKVITEENFDETEFLLELFDLKDKYLKNGEYKIKVNLKDTKENKVLILKEINKYKKFKIIDVDSNIINIKNKNLYFMTLSMVLVILFIGALMGVLFKKKRLVFIGSFVNTIPIILFTTVVIIFNIPITIELFIAMAISLAISTDSTIHFNFRYWKSRLLYGLSKKDSLEEVYFYSGIPIIISTIILILAYIVLLFSNIESLRLLGIYTIIIMLISLIVDFFILPVFLLSIDDKNKE